MADPVTPTDPVVPTFNITRQQIAAFVKEPRTISDLEAFFRMVREVTPELTALAQTTADQGLADASEAEADAQTGITNAATAQAAADAAQASADAAEADAVAAQATADAALAAANAALAAANVQTLLDGISSTQGSVLYRGASAWAALAPGTSGNFLKTQGAAANPIWAAIAAAAYTPPVTASQSGTTYTAALADSNTFIRFTSGSSVTFTIPPNSSVAFPVDTEIHFSQSGAGSVTVAPGAAVTINSRASDLTLAGQYAVAFVKKVATDTWIMNGDL